jgi:hypothetical protein
MSERMWLNLGTSQWDRKDVREASLSDGGKLSSCLTVVGLAEVQFFGERDRSPQSQWHHPCVPLGRVGRRTMLPELIELFLRERTKALIEIAAWRFGRAV